MDTLNQPVGGETLDQAAFFEGLETLYAASAAKGSDIDAQSAAFGEFYSASLRYVAGKVSKAGVPTEAVDDVAHEVYIKLWRNRERYEPNRFSGYLARICQNASFDHYRKVTSRQNLTHSYLADEVDPTSEHGLNSVEEHLALAGVLRGLSDPHRAVASHLAVGRTYQEIAKAEGINMGTVRSRIFRMRDALGRLLTEAEKIRP